MLRVSTILLAALTLAGCAALTPPAPAPADCGCASLEAWVAYVNHVDGLDETGLMQEYALTLERYRAEPDDATRLRLSYLLSRSQLPERDVAMSQVLLTQIPADSPYAPLRTLLAQQIALMIDLQGARQQSQQLRAQLEALKGIDTDMTRGQEEIEELSQ